MSLTRLETDKSDYQPGETAIITAGGFTAGSEVTFEVEHVSGPGADGIYGTPDDEVIVLGGEGHDPWTVRDGDDNDLDGLVNGQIITWWYVNPDDSLDQRFLLAAVASDGWSASTTFTDGNPNASTLAVDAVVTGMTDALFEAYTTAGSTGTGVISSFVRIQAPGSSSFESGYNTNGRPLQFDENSSSQFTYAITLSMVPLVSIDGSHYYQFNLDLNESDRNVGPLITLHNIKLFASGSSTLNNMDPATRLFDPTQATLLFDMDALENVSVLLTDWNSGSGTGDYRVSIPVSYFAGVSQNAFIYLYSEFGTKNGQGSPAEGGFEEWFVVRQTLAALTIDKVFINVTGGNGNEAADFAGDMLNYTVTVTNTGNVTLTNVVVTDPLTGLNTTIASLAAGASQVFNTSYILTQEDLDTNGGGDGDIDNTASADSDQTEPQSDSEQVPLQVSKSLAIDKSASVPSVSAPGSVTYTYVVTNTGNAAISGVTVIDDNATPGDTGDDVEPTYVSGDLDGNGLLDVGESWTYTYQFTVTQQMIDAGTAIVNIATASGDGADDETDTETVSVIQTPALTIDKLFINVTGGNGNEAADFAGDVLNYTVTVANTGNVTLTNVVVTDPLTGLNTTIASLAVGDTQVLNTSYILTQEDLDTNGDGDGNIDNTASADSDQTEPQSDSEQVPLQVSKSLAIDKSANALSVSAPGGVTYTYVVTNTGNAAISGVTVIDDNATPGDTADDVEPTYVSGDLDGDGLLDVGESWTYTYQFTVTQQMIDAGAAIVNVATASGEDAGSDSDTETVTVIQIRSLTIDKTANMTSVSAPGSVTYTYVVTNTGNVAISGVTVVDDNATPGDTADDVEPAYVSGDLDGDGLLDVGESWTYTYQFTVTHQMIDTGAAIVNIATASGDGAGSATDTETVTVNQRPSIDLNKLTVHAGIEGDGLTGLKVGDAVIWRYYVTNTGNTTLQNVTVVDDNGTAGNATDDFTLTLADGYVEGDDNGNEKLDVGETWIFEKSGTAVSGTYTNIGTAYGYLGETGVSDADHSSYTAMPPASGVIAPTNTTPYQYISGTYQTFQDYYADQGGVIQYGVKGGKISQTNPGVFFYFTGATGGIVAVDGNGDGKADVLTVVIDQQRTLINPGGGTVTPHFIPQSFSKNNYSNIQVYKVIDDGDGVIDAGDSLQSIKLRANAVSINSDGDLSISFTPDEVHAMYIISVKYATAGVVGYSLPGGQTVWPTVNYTFSTVVGGSVIETHDGGVNLAPKPVSTMNLAGEAGDGAPSLKEGQLKGLMKAAVAYWEAQGHDVSMLDDVSVGIADLGMEDGSWVLGSTMGNSILIDDDAAGHGWSLGRGAVAPHRVDLFSVLVHELGHVLGMEDEHMGDGLAVGQRLLPEAMASDDALPMPALLGMVGMPSHVPETLFA